MPPPPDRPDPSDSADPKMRFLRGLTAEVITSRALGSARAGGSPVNRHGVLGVCLGHELIAAEL
ncbi:hypothetical protein, partial [Streptomyces viridosporus]|uniref:hypothetical protein n=1 Tax=Streptomyces viridosporus TaxID=67581 RepID=UPI0005BC6AF0